MRGGANPGAIVCREALKGNVVLGTDLKNNQQTFCQFKDGSVIDSGAIFYYAKLNDHKKTFDEYMKKHFVKSIFKK